jgi:hypothetical protein
MDGTAGRDADRLKMLAVTVAVGLLVAACGAPRGGGEVMVRGSVFSDFRVDLPCQEQQGSAPEELSGIRMTFRDDAGTPLADTRSGPLESQQLDYGCRFLARYSVALPQASGYQVEFDPPEPRELPGGGFYQGAEDLGPESISYQELEEQGFEWSFEAEPLFAVP